MTDPREQAREQFIASLTPDSKIAARELWATLEATDPLYQWHDWFSHAYETQALHDDVRVWDDLREALYNACREVLQRVGITVDSDAWRFLVPYIGGGWMMTHDARPSMQHVIQEEQ